MCKTSDANKENVSKTQAQQTKVQGELKKVTKENKDLKKKNESLVDDITDLKCRSMRDNLVFIGIPETVTSQPTMGLMEAAGGVGSFDSGTAMDSSQSQDGQGKSQSDPWHPKSYSQVAAGEDCNEKVWEFCRSVLNIHNASNRVFIDRAHRLGPFRSDKPRAMIVKFKDTDSKMLVKNAAKELDLKNTPFGVFDQYPPEVQEKRRSLIPKMLEAKAQHKKAVLVRDKLYINNKLYEPSTETSDDE